ncbi:predicted protein [Nematostella vectensis]|uniref:Uncharacterized protein n=1 Tax=Nematostella vectensis TaxID=45351 RepID=A7SRN9_NEMVE|nr:predicted protein [Nematostella vectensis]|eukprot:XP_001625729.1 predicted protein [Nematostella vectensis]
MVETTEIDLNSPPKLLYALCCKILGKDTAAKGNHFQYALRVVGSRMESAVGNDEFRVVERVKRKLVKENRELDAAIFSELYRKLASQAVMTNRWGILCFLLNISEAKSNDSSQKTQTDHFFGHGLPLASTSTPATGVPPLPGSRAISLVHSSHSSGFSSIQSSGTRPDSTLSSVTPGYGHAAQGAEGTQLASMVAQSLALSQQKQSGFQESQTPGRQAVAKLISYMIVQGYKEGEPAVRDASYEISEAVLLREIIYIFQGIEGTIIKLDPTTDAYRISNNVGVPKSVRDLVNKLGELGWLYRKVRKYLDARSGDRALGLVGQSFCAALQQELSEYYRLMAVLEGQQQLSDQGVVGEGASGSLTLRRLVIWTYDPLLRLRTLAALVDTCKGKKGGALLSAIHTYMQHGDPFVRSLVKHMLNLVSKTILDRWVYEGELEDQYQEFFIEVDYTVRDERLWFDKYSLRKQMLPSFIPIDMATKILNIGKSINFIRHVCQDRSPIGTSGEQSLGRTKSEENAGITAAQLTADEEFSGPALQEMIDTAYSVTSKKLLEILFTKYQFLDHLKALRLYMLLGQGDFIRHLMDLLEPDLAKPASTLYMHNLTGVMETAIRATNAQYENPEILKRLDCRLLEVSPGDTGWDVFSLDYHVDGPISTVFTSECMIHYLRIFNFLWRAKRMEYSLTGIWKAQMENSRLIETIPELSPILHQCHTLGSEMVHFIHQMQYYIAFEVLECCWADLKKRVTEASDLDHIIAAHETFLDQVISRSLLDTESKSMLAQLRTIFDLIVQFQHAQDELYTASVQEVDSRNRLRAAVNRKTDQGDWGMTDQDEEEDRKRSVQFVDHIIPETKAHIRVLYQSYQDMVQKFLMMLTSHQDVSLRFLSFRLDFNEHYKTKEPKLTSPLTHRFSKRYKKVDN